MAQQTQMDRVVEYWKRWMVRYPDLKTLSQASEEDVLKSWEGLGYYSRARNIRKAASLIIDTHDGVFPTTFKEIHSLPGVGEYTAGAISSIALNMVEPAIDANVLRVFSRILNIAKPVKDAVVKNKWNCWFEKSFLNRVLAILIRHSWNLAPSFVPSVLPVNPVQ